MWKLQQLLFLVSRKRGIGIKKMGALEGGVGIFCAELEIGGSRASQEVFQRDEAWGDGDLGCPKTLGSQWRFQNSNGMCQGRSQG